MATTRNPKQTSKKVASAAGKALANPKTPKPLRSIIASDLAQAAKKKAKKAK